MNESALKYIYECSSAERFKSISIIEININYIFEILKALGLL